MKCDQQNSEGNRALHMASQTGNLEMCVELLKHKANINCVTLHKITPLAIACTNGQEQVVQQLLSSHADVQIANTNNESPPFDRFNAWFFQIS